MSLIVLLLATASALRSVGGQDFPYRLAIDFHHYSNPSHTTAFGLCCNPGCATDCDTSLQLCFRSGGTSLDSTSCIAIFSLGRIGGDTVTFTDAVGDKNNPYAIIITFLRANGYQLVIEPFITGSDFIVDRIVIEIPASTLGQSSPPQNYTGDFRLDPPVTINLGYSLGCSPSYKLCTVNTLLQCVPEEECIGGSELVSTLTPQTVLALLPVSDSSSSGPASTFVLSATPSATPSSSFSMDAAGAVPAAAIAGGVLGALVIVAAIAILVSVGVVIFHRRRKKQPSPASDALSNTYMLYSELYRENSVHTSQSTPAVMHQKPGEQVVYEDVGDRPRGNTYEDIGPDHNPQSTVVDVPNPMYQTNTLLGSGEPAYEDLNRDRNNTLLEVSNSMYETTQLQQSYETEYQETRREVKNVLYED